MFRSLGVEFIVSIAVFAASSLSWGQTVPISDEQVPIYMNPGSLMRQDKLPDRGYGEVKGTLIISASKLSHSDDRFVRVHEYAIAFMMIE
jgi:hypothetical protein